MSDEIRVKVNSAMVRAGRCPWFGLIRFREEKAKSAGTTDWREAERQAGELEKELRAGRLPPVQVVMGRLPQAVRGGEGCRPWPLRR